MSRRGKANSGRKRLLTDTDAEIRFHQSLLIIASLCDHIDAGVHHMSLPLAVELMNILGSPGYGARKRGEVKFLTPDIDDDPRNMMAFYKLTGVQIHSQPMRGDFIACAMQGAPNGWRHMKFAHWWNEVIFRASNSKPGVPMGVVSLLPEDQVAYDHRERLTRRQLVQSFRDHAGAHHLPDWPVLFDDIDGPSSWGGFEFEDQGTGNTYSTNDGSLTWGMGQLGASVREIAEEALIAFGLRPLPTQRSSEEAPGGLALELVMSSKLLFDPDAPL